MKIIMFSILLNFLFLTILCNAQEIHFTNPINGMVITGTGYGSTASTVPVNLSFYYQLSENPDVQGMFVKLFPSPYATQQSNQGNGISQWWYLPSGIYTWRIELWEYYTNGSSFKTAEHTITFQVKYNIQVINNFGGGYIYVDGQQRLHGYVISKLSGESLQIGAIDQQYNGNNYIWNQSGINNSNWQKKKMGQLQFSELANSSSRIYNYNVNNDDNGAQIRADLRKICSITFQNSFVGISNGGKIQVNGITYDLPTSAFNVVELNPIVASPVDRQTFNNIIYHFSKWSDGNTSFNRTFYPSATATYTAQFIGKPSIANRNLHTGQVYNQPIVLYWNEHPNAYVTKYQILRQVKHNGVLGNPQILATVNRGTLSYVDYDYVLTNGYTADLIFYDVRPFYSLEGTYSDPSWMPVYGDGSVVPKSSDSTLVNKEEFDYSISNYPNPFNPVTNIQINMKDAGYVNVSVYDLLGQKVAEIVNEEKEAGRYTLLFDGSELPSGTYIYTMRVGNYSESRKMILMK